MDITTLEMTVDKHRNIHVNVWVKCNSVDDLDLLLDWLELAKKLMLDWQKLCKDKQKVPLPSICPSPGSRKTS